MCIRDSYMAGDEKAVRGRYEPEESAQAAYRQFTSSRSYEDALIMTDIKGELWPQMCIRDRYDDGNAVPV